MHVATTPPTLQKAAPTIRAGVIRGKATCSILKLKTIAVAHGMPKATRKKTIIEAVGCGRSLPARAPSARFVSIYAVTVSLENDDSSC
jgi:hypothetical protein